MVERDCGVHRRASDHRVLVEDDAVGVIRRCGGQVAIRWCAAEKHHRPRDLLQHVAEVLGAHDWIRQPHHLVGADQLVGEIEDDIRLKEQARAFDDAFVQLARSVYFENDTRARIKRQINLALGSELVEEKSYQDYASGSAPPGSAA